MKRREAIRVIDDPRALALRLRPRSCSMCSACGRRLRRRPRPSSRSTSPIARWMPNSDHISLASTTSSNRESPALISSSMARCRVRSKTRLSKNAPSRCSRLRRSPTMRPAPSPLPPSSRMAMRFGPASWWLPTATSRLKGSRHQMRGLVYPQIGIVTTVAHGRPHGGRAVQLTARRPFRHAAACRQPLLDRVDRRRLARRRDHGAR